MQNTYESVLEITEINGKIINVVGVWNSEADYQENKDPEFYDVYSYEPDEIIGTCINEGDPFYEMPTVADCEQLLKEYLKD